MPPNTQQADYSGKDTYSLKVFVAISSGEIERVMIITLAVAHSQYTHYPTWAKIMFSIKIVKSF